jgi:hypothetical protein
LGVIPSDGGGLVGSGAMWSALAAVAGANWGPVWDGGRIFIDIGILAVSVIVRLAFCRSNSLLMAGIVSGYSSGVDCT